MTTVQATQRGPAEIKASNWIGWMWLLALVATVGGLILFGNVFGGENYEGEFNGNAAFLGAILGFVFFLPWIGVFSVLQALARSTERPAGRPEASRPPPPTEPTDT